MTGVGRRRPRTGQPGTRRRSVNTIPPLVDERSDQRNHNNMESDNNTGQVATVRGRQAGGARDDKDSNKPTHSTPFVATRQTSLERFAVQDPFETKNFKESDNINDRTPSKPAGSEHNTARRSKDCNSTTSSGWLSRRKQRVDESHPGPDEQAVK